LVPSSLGVYIVGISLVEVECNWRSVHNLRTRGERLWPSAEKLKTDGIEICSEPTSVLIGFHNREDTEVSEVRDWILDNCREKYKLYHRFHYEIFPYQSKRSYMGVNFRFEDDNDAFFFKMRWY
jgi:hypothetical protein